MSDRVDLTEGLHCTQGHFVPFFGPATWLSIGDVKFCMQCVYERVVPFLDSLGVGRVVEESKKASQS